ncbi:S-layer protein [Levilactobacillus parabrevis]|uniref:S-layer protein n=1 Tax=Levilactobacillus parabrevis TaxID=357278 RepID=UPI0037565EBF
MQSSLKKSLYLGLAALSFVSVAAVSTTASAKSAAKVTSDKVLTSDATTRNINLTGTNAIYTKPGTIKGAKVVATTTTTKNLKNDKTSQKNFRAYRMAKTNRGSYYYKVVSYDKQYRGWVYGGKTANKFNGGVDSYTTFKDGTLTADQQAGAYKITNAGKTTDGLTYKQPAWTQYKIGKTMADTTAYKNATFSIDKTGTRTREGDTWVHIVNQNTADTKADGWILASNLTNTKALNEASQVKVVVKDLSGNTLKTFNYTTGVSGVGTDATANLYAGTPLDFTPNFAKEVTNNLTGTGYAVDGKGAYNQYAKVVNGQTVTLYAKQGDKVPTKANIYLQDVKGTAAVTLAQVAKDDTPVADADAAAGIILAPKDTTNLFTGNNGASFTAADALAYLKGNDSLKTLNSPSWDETDSTTGAKTTYHYVYTPQSAKAGVFGTAFDATYVGVKTAVNTAVTPGENGGSPITNVPTPSQAQ